MDAGPRRLFALLTLLHQLPAGMALAAWLLTAQARGLEATDIGVLVAVVALGVALLELPTGALADVLGRRGVLAAAAVLHAVAFAGLALAGSFAGLVTAAAVFAVAGALSSGPLEAWFVDRVGAQADEVRRGLGLAGTATGVGLAAGGLLGGGLALLGSRLGLPEVGTAGVVALSIPMAAAALLSLVEAALVFRVVRDDRVVRGKHEKSAGVRVATVQTLLRELPQVVGSGARLAVADAVLRWFCLRWLLVPVGFLAFELLSPLRLAELADHPARAAAVMGPLAAGCFLGIGLTAASAPWLAARVGALPAAAATTVAAGVCFALAGTGGVVTLVVAVLAGFVVSGPGNPLLAPLVHERVDGARRATVLSVRSLIANVAVGLGALVLGVVGEQSGTGWAFALAGALTVLAALPLIGVAAAQRRQPPA